MQQQHRLVAYGFLLCEVTLTTITPLSWNGWFTSQLAPQSMSPVLCWEFSEAGYIDWLIALSWNIDWLILKKWCWDVYIEITQSLERTFRVEYVNAIMFAKISGEAIARFARSWLRPCLHQTVQIRFVFVLKMFQDKCNRDFNRGYLQCNRNRLYWDFVCS